MRHILLVEPPYNNKYPPLGLMKISTYHKFKGDFVQFVKGSDQSLRKKKWDRIYISTLFTFYWDITIKTIRYYLDSVHSPKDIFVGGVMATLFSEEIIRELGVTVISGLLNQQGILDSNDHHIIDALIPDYKILDETNYSYGLNDSYIGYATRGCPNRCPFCAVHKIEPMFDHYVYLKKQIKGIEEVYGAKKDLTLLDNNVLASENFERIINDILELGFERGAKFNNKLRRLDFNQGLDARYLTCEKMALLSKTAIKPVRIAFDHIDMKELYISKVKLAYNNGISDISNYVLFNYTDTPEDCYERLKINIILNKELDIKIYSFPMKYIPLDAKDRTYIGHHWNKRLLRGIQCILLVTKGKVSPGQEFFEAAFGQSAEDFIQIAMMPDDYIIFREQHKNNGAYDWKCLYKKLSKNQQEQLADIVSKQRMNESILKGTPPSNLRKILIHYIEAEKISQLRKKQRKEIE